jgi:hypothetical protein
MNRRNIMTNTSVTAETQVAPSTPDEQLQDLQRLVDILMDNAQGVALLANELGTQDEDADDEDDGSEVFDAAVALLMEVEAFKLRLGPLFDELSAAVKAAD